MYIVACECNEEGSANDNCDVATGQCVCKANFHGLHCDECKNGYYEYPNCLCKYCIELDNKLKHLINFFWYLF